MGQIYDNIFGINLAFSAPLLVNKKCHGFSIGDLQIHAVCSVHTDFLCSFVLVSSFFLV